MKQQVSRLVICLASGFCWSSAFPQSFQITTNTSNQSLPAVWGNLVVWQDNRNYSRTLTDIWGKDLTTGQEFKVTDRQRFQSAPSVWGQVVVWEDNGVASDYDIYGKNIATGQELVICIESGDQRSPQIHRDWVVWSDKRGTSWDIYAKNVLTGEQKVVANTAEDELNPRIWGTVVVWEVKRPNSYDVYARNILEETPINIAVGNASHRHPDIWGKTVVWADNRSGKWNIWGRRLDGEEFPITVSDQDQDFPRIFGQNVVYQESGSVNRVVAVNILTAAAESVDTAANADQLTPAIFAQRVVWTDLRNNNYDIYGSALDATLTSIVQSAAPNQFAVGKNFFGFPMLTSGEPTDYIPFNRLVRLLQRWNQEYQRPELYPAHFRNIHDMEAYWLNVLQPLQPTGNGLEPNGEQLLQIANVGQAWIASPFRYGIPLTSVDVINSATGEVRTAAEDQESPSPWVAWPLKFYDSTARIYKTCAPQGADDNTLRPWSGYLIRTLTSDVTLVIYPRT